MGEAPEVIWATRETEGIEIEGIEKLKLMDQIPRKQNEIFMAFASDYALSDRPDFYVYSPRVS